MIKEFGIEKLGLQYYIVNGIIGDAQVASMIDDDVI